MALGLATFARVAMAYVRASKRVQLLRACIRGVLDLLLARRAERVAVMQIGAHLAWMNYNDPFGSVVRHTLNRRNATAFLAVVVEPQPTCSKGSGRARSSLQQAVSFDSRTWQSAPPALPQWTFSWSTPALTW